MNTLDYIKEAMQKLWDWHFMKVVAAAMIWVIRMLFGDYRPAIGAVVVLFLIDFILGFSFALKTTGISSDRSLRGASKALVYFCLFIVSNQIKSAPIIGAVIVSIVDALIIVTESISVLEKVDKWLDLRGIDSSVIDTILSLLMQKKKRLMEDDKKVS